jgi:PKD repeat protein
LFNLRPGASSVGYGKLGSSLRRVLIILLLAFALLASTRISHPASAQTNDMTALYVSPIKTWSQPSVVVNVNINLSSADSVAGYEVYMSYNRDVLNASGVQWGNLFPSDRVFNASICINDVGTGCIGGLDNINVVHFNVAYLDGPVYGPVSRTLFSIQFSVLGPGRSVFQFFNDSIFGDAQPPSNLPVSVIHVTWNGIYSNNGLQAFFNVAPAILIVGLPVSFDASSSFNPKNSSAAYYSGLTYTWDFGDGAFGRGVTTPHSYTSVGSYSASLTVSDSSGVTSSISRVIAVVSAFGTLQIFITDSVGNALSQSVTVKLSNSSVSETVTRAAGNTGPVTFSKLEAGSYQVDFSGSQIISASRQEKVLEGWTTVDYVGLSVVPTHDPSRSDIGFYLLLGTLASLPIIGVFLVVRRRALKRKARRDTQPSD